jgi:ribose-phosphate pyrophosphokinase
MEIVYAISSYRKLKRRAAGMNTSTKTQWFDPFGGHPFAQAIRRKLNGHPRFKEGRFILRKFPDGETYIQINSDVCSQVIIFADLANPDPKILTLLLFANTIRDLGAEKITLITPYLPYMRQDIRFKNGEAVTSRYFAKLLSDAFDEMITIDPHFHRYASLDDLYTLHGIALSGAEIIAEWIRNHFENPVLVGPDTESGRWVSGVAELLGCDYRVFAKTRFGDREVAIDTGKIEDLQGSVPIILDDIISTGRTMISAATEMVEMGLPKPVCIAVHAVFADDALQAMEKSAIEQIITCNTISHSTNEIDLTELIINELFNPCASVEEPREQSFTM